MIFITLVLQKGIWGLPNFVREISSRGWKCSLKFQVFTAQLPFSMPTKMLHSSMQKHSVVCILLLFLPVLQLSSTTFPLPFYSALLHLFESWVSIWVLFLQSLLISWTGWLGEECRLRENEWWSQEHTSVWFSEPCSFHWAFLSLS